jgi:hypothetical protein
VRSSRRQQIADDPRCRLDLAGVSIMTVPRCIDHGGRSFTGSDDSFAISQADLAAFL